MIQASVARRLNTSTMEQIVVVKTLFKQRLVIGHKRACLIRMYHSVLYYLCIY